MKIKSKIIMVMSLLSLALIFAAPIAVLAHGNERNDDNGRHLGRTVSVERSSGNSRHSENEIEFESEDDHDEDGDKGKNNRRQRGRRARNATSTPRVITVSNPLRAPVISNAIAMVGTTSVQLNWTTNVPSSSEVYYSTSSPVVIGASSSKFLTDMALKTSHSLTLNNLAASTVYHFLIRSTNASSTSKTSNQFTIHLPSGI